MWRSSTLGVDNHGATMVEYLVVVAMVLAMAGGFLSIREALANDAEDIGADVRRLWAGPNSRAEAVPVGAHYIEALGSTGALTDGLRPPGHADPPILAPQVTSGIGTFDESPAPVAYSGGNGTLDPPLPPVFPPYVDTVERADERFARIAASHARLKTETGGRGTGLGEWQDIWAAHSPILVDRIIASYEAGWTIDWMREDIRLMGYANHEAREIRVAVVTWGSVTHDGNPITRILAHEIAHQAMGEPSFPGLPDEPRDEFVERALNERFRHEGEAELETYIVLSQIGENGGSATCEWGLPTEYREIYAQYQSDGDRESAVGRFTEVYRATVARRQPEYEARYRRSMEELWDERRESSHGNADPPP